MSECQYIEHDYLNEFTTETITKHPFDHTEAFNAAYVK
jgi:hypothetical protein